MKRQLFAIISFFCLMALIVLYFNPLSVRASTNNTLKVVGLYSETAAGSISYRVGSNDWKVAQVGEQIPTNAEIIITVDRDWIELSPANNPNAVYEITGSEKGEVRKNISELLKGKAKTVSFPKSDGQKNDPNFVNKVVVKEYLGRQCYMKDTNTGWQDIKYGDVLEIGGIVNIIATNNILILVLPNGKETKIVGPVRFTIEKLLKGENLYKYLNVH